MLGHTNGQADSTQMDGQRGRQMDAGNNNTPLAFGLRGKTI